MKPPGELVDIVMEGEGYGYDDEEMVFVLKMEELLSDGRGITLRQWRKLNAIVRETQMYLAGYSPFDE